MNLLRGEKAWLLAGIVAFGLVGLLMLWWAWHTTREARSFLPLSLPATGRVIELVRVIDEDSDNKRTVSYHPVIEFSTGDGSKIRFRSKLAVDQFKHPVGWTPYIWSGMAAAPVEPSSISALRP